MRRATSSAGKAEVVVQLRNQTGESPVWHAGEQALYWVDIPAGILHRWRPGDQQHASWRAGQQLSCIAALPSGGWVGGMEDGIYRLTPGPDQTLAAERLVKAPHARAGMRFNDGRCDRQGRFWAGTMLSDMSQPAAVGALYRLAGRDADLRLEQVFDGMLVPNGLAFSPDGRTMYLSDSHPQQQRVWAFDYDIEQGMPRNRRLFIEALAAGRPDGAAIDAEGCYWICGNDAGLVHRYTPEGRLDRSMRVPVAKPAMCAFGGKDLDTLFVTSIRLPDAAPHSLDGAVFALNPGVCGIAESACIIS
ncbi:SMP-30/gluconolactonase/LRE family protein [Castellaniella sp.]|uniref:SMP-30/gluconolactonase/LRE family protein n=1 Tax=Castellaniella sp. TaxID=1955812 RepID=UPI003C7913FD